MPEVTIGVDVGTTSVKAVAVDGEGRVVARSRVPHGVMAPEPDILRHDAKRAWRAGPRKAFAHVREQLEGHGAHRLAGVAVASMVPSLTAVSRQGVPLLAGLLYGDREGRPAATPGTETVLLPGTMPDAEGFLRWASADGPRGPRLLAVPGRGHPRALGTAGGRHGGHRVVRCPARPRALEHGHAPFVRRGGGADARWSCRWARPPAPCPGSDTVITGGTIDALCDQIVAGATEPGDVLVIFGATLIVWVVCDEWVEVPGLISYPHTTPERFLIGGPSNAGALFVDWARGLLRGVATARDPSVSASSRGWATPPASRSGCPTCGASARRSRTTRCARTSTGSTSAQVPRRSSAPPTRPAAS